jgi:urease accessory protein
MEKRRQSMFAGLELKPTDSICMERGRAQGPPLQFFVIFFLLAFMLISPELFAHAEKGVAAGFGTGFLHPISGWDHILAMIAVGLWGAELGAPAIWILPVTFPMMMAFGGFIGLLGIPLPGVEYGIGISALVLGILVALEKRLPIGLCMVIVGFFALFHGYAHGAELKPGTSALAYSLGFVVATGCLHGVGILIGLIHKWPIGRRVVRACGVFIAAAGVFFIWQAFR